MKKLQKSSSENCLQTRILFFVTAKYRKNLFVTRISILARKKTDEISNKAIRMFRSILFVFLWKIILFFYPKGAYDPPPFTESRRTRLTPSDLF